jgi:diacylglycerol kinase (ATP)
MTSRLSLFFQSRVQSFRYAFAGLWYVLRTQRNAWIHAAASALVISICAWLGLTRQEWALIVMAIALVWTAEFLNTALEAVVDLASQQSKHELARVGKDVGAAAVLIAAASSAVIGLLVLGPALWERLRALVAR